MKEEYPEILVRKLKGITIEFVNSLPEDIKKQVGNIWFVFDRDTIMYKDNLLVFASHEPGLRTITFYITVIAMHDFDDKRLKELVQHEYAHAVGMTEEQVTKIMNKEK